MRSLSALLLTLTFAAALPGAPPTDVAADTLEKQLQKEAPAALAQEARAKGDPIRGAILFYQPALTCSKCHLPGEKQATLGPDLAAADKGVTGDYLVEAILDPSKEIKKGYET